jgi:hypothetical protein
MGAELLHANGQIEIHDEGNCRFSQCCEKRLKLKGILVPFKQAAIFIVISQTLRRYSITETHTCIQLTFPLT